MSGHADNTLVIVAEIYYIGSQSEMIAMASQLAAAAGLEVRTWVNTEPTADRNGF